MYSATWWRQYICFMMWQLLYQQFKGGSAGLWLLHYKAHQWCSGTGQCTAASSVQFHQMSSWCAMSPTVFSWGVGTAGIQRWYRIEVLLEIYYIYIPASQKDMKLGSYCILQGTMAPPHWILMAVSTCRSPWWLPLLHRHTEWRHTVLTDSNSRIIPIILLCQRFQTLASGNICNWETTIIIFTF